MWHIGFSDELNTRIVETGPDNSSTVSFHTPGLHGSRVIGVLYGVVGTDCHARICIRSNLDTSMFAWLSCREGFERLYPRNSESNSSALATVRLPRQYLKAWPGNRSAYTEAAFGFGSRPTQVREAYRITSLSGIDLNTYVE